MKETGSMVEMARRYLDHRHKLGSQFHCQGMQVMAFAEYADGIGHDGPITTELALRWACLRPEDTSINRARRLQHVRCFARYAAMFDAGTEIPPRSLLGSCNRRIQPHIFSDMEVRQLMDEAGRLPPAGGLRPRTYVVLFGLLASTGIRIGEAVRLKRQDVDLDRGVLRIVGSKFKKSRLVALHPTTCAKLRAYRGFRDSYPCPPRDPCAFFLSERGKPLSRGMAEFIFWGISRRLGWNETGGRGHPRLYDFRHTFACRRIWLWYRDGADVEHAMASLSTYMGHGTLRDTYWYLTGLPELMQIAAARFEQFANSTQEVVP